MGGGRGYQKLPKAANNAIKLTGQRSPPPPFFYEQICEKVWIHLVKLLFTLPFTTLFFFFFAIFFVIYSNIFSFFHLIYTATFFFFAFSRFSFNAYPSASYLSRWGGGGAIHTSCRITLLIGRRGCRPCEWKHFGNNLPVLSSLICGWLYLFSVPFLLIFFLSRPFFCYKL